MTYRYEIDGLRAVAVLSVILFHANFQWFEGGFLGVDIFFVISGYLISNIIISGIAGDRFRLLNFYEQRARRILPALFLVMLVSLVFALLTFSPRSLKDFGQSLFATSLFSSNILFFLETHYFAAGSDLKPLLHTWSLAIEEQFYIIFPLFLLSAWPFGIRWIIIALLIIFFTSLGLAQWGAYNEPNFTFYLLLTRAWELLLGSFIAFYLKFNKFNFGQLSNQILSMSGLSMIIFSLFFFKADTPSPSLYTLAPTLGTGFVILFSTPNTISYKILSFSPLVKIGLISYSAYLWHQPIFTFSRYKINGELSDYQTIAIILISLLLAFFSWKWIERPFRTHSIISSKLILIFSVSGILFFSTIGLLIHLNHGFFHSIHITNPKISNGDLGHVEFRSYVDTKFQKCSSSELATKTTILNGFLRCYQSKNTNPDLILYGDSHAEHIFIGVAENYNGNAMYFTIPGTPVIGEDSYKTLSELMNDNKSVDTILYSSYWALIYSQLGDQLFNQKIHETLAEMKASEKRIILVAGVPHFSNSASSCYHLNKYNLVKNPCALGKTNHLTQQAALSTLIDIAHKLGIEIIDPSVLLCDQNDCNMVKDNSILYRDQNHLNIEGSKIVGNFVVTTIESLERSR